MLLNLAARPFVNRRPWRRLTAVLWALGLALLTLNAVLYWGYLTGSADARAELAGLREQLAGDRTELDGLRTELTRLDVEAQNREVAFLNERIADRRFPWGQLFNDIEQVLPWNTRLRSLAPQRGDRNRRRRAELRAGDQTRVVLDLTGEAQDDQGLLELVDALFEHPAFDDPKLLHESRQDAGPLDFTIAVVYLPDAAPGGADAVADDADAAEVAANADAVEAAANANAADAAAPADNANDADAGAAPLEARP